MSDQFFTTNAGLPVPRLLYGTAWKEERTAELVLKALGHGFRGVDTACQPKHYHEQGVGEALATLGRRGIPRGEFFIQTKFTPLSGQDPRRVPYDADAPLGEQVRQSMAVSLANLGTNYVDSLVLHSPLTRFAETMEVWAAMEDLQESGQTRGLGISNCYDLAALAKIYDAAEIKPGVVQNRLYRDTGYDHALRAWCHDKGIVYQSFWTLTANPHILNNTSLKQIARQHAKSEAQVFFRYLTQRGVAPLSGTTSDTHMQEDLAIFTFTLPLEALDTMDRLLR